MVCRYWRQFRFISRVLNTRTLESIFRIAKAFARLHLSSVVDDSICDETIVFMNEMFQDFHCAIHVVENPGLYIQCNNESYPEPQGEDRVE